jgi:hypothetical protein
MLPGHSDDKCINRTALQNLTMRIRQSSNVCLTIITLKNEINLKQHFNNGKKKGIFQFTLDFVPAFFRIPVNTTI